MRSGHFRSEAMRMTGTCSCVATGMGSFGRKASKMNSSPSNTPPMYKKYCNKGIRGAITAASKLIRERLGLLMVFASHVERAAQPKQLLRNRKCGELADGFARTSN